jgi:hypothetical protein
MILKFIKIPNDAKLINFLKLYMVYCEICSGEYYYAIKYGIELNFCINQLSNDCAHSNNYIMFAISQFEIVFEKFVNNYYFEYYTLNKLENYVKNKQRFVNVFVINNFDDLAKYYETINNSQEQSIETNIFIKLSS